MKRRRNGKDRRSEAAKRISPAMVKSLQRARKAERTGEKLLDPTQFGKSDEPKPRRRRRRRS